MLLNLTIERQGLPPARVRWSTDSFTATHSTTNNSNPTIAQLIEQINDVIPLEDADWGLEDYTVEVNGFECLHFCRASQVLKENDKVTIRPLQTSEVRFRALSGRSQISADGRHLIDGVSFGKPFLRRGVRPQVRIQPRRRSRASFDDADDEYYDDEDEPAGLLMPGCANQPAETSHEPLTGEFSASAQRSAPILNYFRNLNPQNISADVQGRKRQLEPAFEEAREGKRIRSALQSARKPSGISSINSKNVRFEEAGAPSTDATPSTIHANLDSEDSEDDDYDPDSDEWKSGSESESDKENLNPETHQYAPRRYHASTAGDEPSRQALAAPITLADVAPERQSSVTSSSVETSEPSSSSEDDSDDEDSDSSDVSSSEDKTSSDSDDENEAVSEAPSQQAQTAETSFSQVSPGITPPGQGKLETKKRNQRRRIHARLNKLKELGHLPANAKADDLLEWQASHGQQHQQSDTALFEANRQALLDALANGGVDVEAKPTDFARVDGQDQGTETMGQDLSSPKYRQNGSYHSPKYAAGSGMSRSGSKSTSPLPTKSRSGDVPSQETPPEAKRRRVDLGASQRLLFGGLGLRAPKSKAEEDKLRSASKQRSQQEFDKHQKHAEQEQEQPATAPVDDDWREHIELKSVECTDPSIQYSTPPFPFEQRWDPQQHYNNWRPRNNGKNKKKNPKRKLQQIDIEEHYDANMYDEQPAQPEHGEIDQMDVDPQQETMDKHIMPILDVSDKVDLLVEQAMVGAKIAFKHLFVSEATSWQPQESAYRIAVVTSNMDGALTLSIDEQYRVEKAIDPETGEPVASRFIIADAQESEDEGILEIEYSALIEPKLLIPAATPVSSQQQRDTAPDVPANVIDALANDLYTSSKKESLNTTVEGESGIDGTEETIVDVSFNTTADTAVGIVKGAAHKAKETAEPREDISPQSRDEASMLIHDAGFRSAVDPEVNKPLEERHEAAYPDLLSRIIEKASPLSAEEILGDFDRLNEVALQTNSTRNRQYANEDGSDEDDALFFAMRDNNSSQPAPSDSVEDTNADADSGTSGVASSTAVHHAQQDIDIVSLQDSSQEMVTEKLQEIVPESPESEASTPSSVIRHPGQDIDLARQIMTGNGAEAETAREFSPDAAPIEQDDVEEVSENEHVNNNGDSQDSLPDWESILDAPRASVSLSQPSSRSVKTKKTHGSSKSTGRSFSATQPGPARNTRKAARRATAMANTISLLSDDDDDADVKAKTMPASTAPVGAVFKPINAPSASQPASNRRHTSNAVNLTELISSPMDSDSDDFGPSGTIRFTSFAKKGASLRDRLKNRKSENLSRTKSQV